MAFVSLLSSVESFRHDLEAWAPAAEWGVALGTILLAIATFVVARRARDEAAAVRDEAEQVREQITLQRDEAAERLRPCVYPVTPPEWAYARGEFEGQRDRLLLVKNGGKGIALEAGGHISWRDEHGNAIRTELVAGPIGPSDELVARLVPHPGVLRWTDATGTLIFKDASGLEYQTRFGFEVAPGNEIRVRITALDTTEALRQAGIIA